MNNHAKFRISIVTYFKALSVLLFLAGYGALECLHRFSSDTAEIAISTQLENNHPIAWLFIAIFALLIGLLLWAQVLSKNKVQIFILVAALLALAGIVTSEQTTLQHTISLIALVLFLSVSILQIATNFSAFTFAIIFSVVFGIVFCSVLLFLVGKPGIAERLLFVVFGISTLIAFSNCSTVSV